MTKDQAASALYVFVRAIMEQLEIAGDTAMNIKLDGKTVKSVTLDEALRAFEHEQQP